MGDIDTGIGKGSRQANIVCGDKAKQRTFAGKQDCLFTVIVPIYNVERYLCQCIDSLLNQSMRNHKIILVNDGSKDRSGEIAESYARQYPDRIMYLSQKNAGLGAARNAGLRYVDTPYVMFLDSDDWMMPRTVEHLTREIRYDADAFDLAFMMPVVYNMASCKYEDWKDKEYLEAVFKQHGKILNPRQVPKLYGTEANICRCVFRVSFLKEHRFQFPEGVKWEDVFPHFYLLYWARRCILVKDAGFFYRIHSGNQITATVSSDRLDIIPVFASVFSYAIKHDWSKTEAAYIVSMMMDFIVWSLHASTRKVQRELVRGLHDMCSVIPVEYYHAYVKIIRPSVMERMIWHGLGSPFAYRFLENNHNLRQARQMYQKAGKLKRIRRRRA